MISAVKDVVGEWSPSDEKMIEDIINKPQLKEKIVDNKLMKARNARKVRNKIASCSRRNNRRV